MNFNHKEDGSIKSNTEAKVTDTGQYHPIVIRTSHSAQAIRTRFDKTNIISDEQDQQEEEMQIQKEFKQCQYPK